MTRQEVRLILQDTCENLEPIQVAELKHSGEWWKFEVNDRYLFRFPKFDRMAQGLRLEYDVLRCLQNKLPVAIPNPEYFAENPRGEPTPFLGYELIEGTPLDSVVEKLEATEILGLAGQLGHFLSALHSLPETEAAAALDLEGRKGPPVTDFDAELRNLDEKLAQIEDHIPVDVAEGCQAASRRCRARRPNA